MLSTMVVLLQLSVHTVDVGYAINPSCTCIRFTSTYGKERGTFSSPDYPRAPPRRACLLYTFLAAPHQIVEVVFTDFDVYKGHLDCSRGDYIKVYSEGSTSGPGPPGVNEYSSWSQLLCGSRMETPPPIYSHGPMLALELHTGGKETNATGFVGTYKFIDRRLFETDGVPVPDTWCDYSFSSAPTRGHGRLYSPRYPSTYPSLFETDGVPVPDTWCDYSFSSAPTRGHGRLYSPRYPSTYPTNVRCTYHFHARQNERIKLLFQESFLQKGDESCLNRADIIKVFDGRVSTAPVLAMLCNEIVGYEILSTGPDMLVQFTANSKTPGQGFKASYQFQPIDNTSTEAEGVRKASVPDALSSGLGPAVSAATSSCHQQFSSDDGRAGRLVSPQYPAPYPQNTHCHYSFTGRGRLRVRLVFEDFHLPIVGEHVVDCESMDSLDIFLYVDGRQEKMASYCGDETPKPIMSNGPKLSIEFRGIYSSRTSRGFNISYSFVEDYAIASGKQLLEFPCAFVFNSSEARTGLVTSPNYPGLYPRDTECNYFFYGDKNERVHLHFNYFDVEGVVPCEAVSASDYVQISSQMIDLESRRYCGQIRDLRATSLNNFLRITFRSNDRLDGVGFSCNYIFLRDSEMYNASIIEASLNGDSSLRFSAWLGLLIAIINELILR